MRYLLTIVFSLLAACAFAQVPTIEEYKAEVNTKVRNASGALSITKGIIADLYDDLADIVDTTADKLELAKDSLRNEFGSIKSTSRILGTLYNASSWNDLSDFDTNFNGVTIDVDGNIHITGGQVDTPKLLSWRYTTCLTSWQLTTEFVVEEKSATSYGIALGIYGTGVQFSLASDWGTFAHLNTSSHATQGGKIYIQSGRNSVHYTTLDSSGSKLTFSAGDVVVLTTKWEYTTMYVYATNITTGSKVTMSYNFGVQTRYNTGNFSVWTKGGEFTIDSLNINSEAVVGIDLLFIGDSKSSCIGVTNIGKCHTRIVQKHFPNSSIHAGIGDHIGDAINSMDEFRKQNPKQALINLYYNDLWTFPADTVCILYKRLTDSLDAIPVPSFKMAPQDYPSAGFPEIRARYDSFRTFLYDTYDSSEIIDAFDEMIRCGTPCGAFSAHPPDTGQELIANVILNSGKLTGATEVHELMQRLIHDSVSVKIDSVTKSNDTFYYWRGSVKKFIGVASSSGSSGGSQDLDGVLTEGNTSAQSATLGGLTIDKSGGGIIATYKSSATDNIGFVEYVNVSGTRMGYYGYGGAGPGNNWLSVWNTANAGVLFGTNNTARGGFRPTGEFFVGTSGTTSPTISSGAGSPEGVVTAPVGSIYQRTDGGAGTAVYHKESGTGNTGWVGK